ncbi:MAG: hypothetical protein WC458_01855 [Patescibacteria group bacterium]
MTTNKNFYKIGIILIIVILGLIVWLLSNKEIKSEPVLTYEPITNSRLANYPLTYNHVMDSKIEGTEDGGYYKSEYEGQPIEWQGKISAHYSQITGIKFCVIDNEHQNVNIDQPCDWFWAFADDLMRANDRVINPNWDGKWVNYILNYYKVPFDNDSRFYNEIYTIQGKINGIDCGADDKCVPDIEIINIIK